MAMYSRAQNSVVGPQGSPMHSQPQYNGGAGSHASQPSGAKMEWVLYVDPNDALCAGAMQSMQHIDPSFIWIQDVAQIERSQRPAWLTGVPALVSIRDQMVYRGTQALQTLQKLVASYQGGGASGTTSLVDVMNVDERQPRAQSHQNYNGNGGGGGGTHSQPAPPGRQSGPGAAASPGLSGQFGSVDDSLNGTMLANGTDDRYEERGKKVTSSQIDAYTQRRKNYAGSNVVPQM